MTVWITSSRAKVIVAAVVLSLLAFGGSAQADAGDPSAEFIRPSLFSDVGFDAKFHTEIIWLAGHQISTGYSDGSFHPKESVSREAFAAFVYRLAGKPEVALPSRSPFTDVKSSDGFYKEIVWLSNMHITTGWSDGTFRPRDKITREAIAAFLYRFDGRPSFSAPGQSPFNDMTISSQFYEEVTWLAISGMTTGYSDGTFRPRTDVSREAVAAFLYRGNTVAARDGSYRVGSEIGPGVYVAFQAGSQSCNWQRFDGDDDWLGTNFTSSGRTVAKIDASDSRFVTKNCTGWTPLQATSANATAFGNGINVVGYHMKAGLYSANGAGGCEWSHYSGLGGSWDEKIEGESPNDPPPAIRLAAGEALRTVNCGTWRRIGA